MKMFIFLMLISWLIQFYDFLLKRFKVTNVFIINKQLFYKINVLLYDYIYYFFYQYNKKSETPIYFKGIYTLQFLV